VFLGYLLGAAVMIVGAVVEVILGINAEGRSLEDIARPLGLSPSSRLSNITGAPRPPAARTVLDLTAPRADPAEASPKWLRSE
jgi:hypothetical protein